MKTKIFVALLLSLLILAFASCSSKIFNQINNFNNSGSTPKDTEPQKNDQSTYAPIDSYPENSYPEETSRKEETHPTPDTTAKQEAHTHTFGDWNTITAPTCTTGGAQVRSCSCGEMESRKTTALGHSTVQVTGKSATCSSTGLTDGEKCTVCGTYIIQQQTLDKLSHDFSQWKTEKEATCSTDGKKTRTCKNCIQTETEIIKSSGNHNYIHGICSACGHASEGSSFLTYRLSDDGTYYICTGSNIHETKQECIIPSYHNGKPVKEIIGNMQFNLIVNLTIMEGIEKIDRCAFDGQTKLKTVYLPSTLKYIGEDAFDYCNNLESVYISTHGWENVYMSGSVYERRTAVDLSNPYTAAAILRKGNGIGEHYERK